MLLFVDTETTGLDKRSYLVQLACILTEEDGTLRGSCNLIVKPDGYEIPSQAAAIHGITTAIAGKAGVPLAVAISLFNNFALQCKDGKLIAHNIKFDRGIIEGCYLRGGWPDRLKDLGEVCTMELMKPVCKLPPSAKMQAAGFKDFKWPRLGEAYQHAFEKPLENAHDALYDVLACKELFFWLRTKGLA